MTNPFDIKNRFRARLRAADAQKHRIRAKLLQDGTRALAPITEALHLMAEVLEEDGIEHGRIDPVREEAQHGVLPDHGSTQLGGRERAVVRIGVNPISDRADEARSGLGNRPGNQNATRH